MKPIHWINSAGGDFTNGADWSGGAVPGAGDRAVIDAPGTYTVTLSSAEAVRSLVLNDAGATVSLGNGANLTLGLSLTLKAGQFELHFGATISGGTLRAKGGQFIWREGTLDGVMYDGPLDMKRRGSFLEIGPNGLILTGRNGTGPGTANLSRGGDLIFNGTQTFDHATVNLNGSDLSGDLSNSEAVLTLGKHLIINHTGLLSMLDGAAIVNEGTINASFHGDGSHDLRIQAKIFTNQGSLVVKNGDTLLLSSVSFTNLVDGTLTGGNYEVDAGSTLGFAFNGSSVVTDDAAITLSGASSVFVGDDFIESTLTTIGAAGTLKLLAGRDWVSTLAMTNQGTLVLDRGSFRAASLANDGLLRGRGTVRVAIADGGTIEAANGTLDLRQAVSGAGTLQVNAKGVLNVEASAAASLTATFNEVGGVLKLGDAAEFAATIADFAAGDTIDLLGLAADSATLQAGDKLVVKNGAQTVATLQLTGDYGGAAFAVASDGRGGSNITVTAGLLAQAMSSMAPAAAGQTSCSAEAWRPHPAILSRPHAMMA